MGISHDAHEGAQRREGLATLGPDRTKGGSGGGGVAVEQPLGGARLNDDRGQVVGGDVVQFPGDPRAFPTTAALARSSRSRAV
jgi:hypothetical protein